MTGRLMGTIVMTIASRLLALLLAVTLVAAICFLPWGFQSDTWRRWDGFEWDRYWSRLGPYYSGLLQGDLGLTTSGTPVSRDIARTAPRSFGLLGLSLGWAAVLGFVAGTMAVSARRRAARSILQLGTFLALSLPDFFVIVCVQSALLFGLRQSGILLLPALGSATLKGMALPAFTLGLLPLAYVSRLVGIALEELEHEDFMRTALAKGLSRQETFVFHALRNVVSTLLAALPSLYGVMISGLVIVEYLTMFPGMGNLAINMFTRQYYWGPDCTVLAGVGIMFTAGYFLLDIGATLIRVWADPRLRGVAGA